MNILLLYGGQSNEHEVSRVSAKFILETLLDMEHTVYLTGVDTAGRWFMQQCLKKKDISFSKDAEKLPLNVPNTETAQYEACVWTIPSNGVWHNLHNPTQLPIDFIFPIIHGYSGEDGIIQSMAESSKIPIVGCSALASRLCFNKQITKHILRSHGIPVLDDLVHSQRSLFNHNESSLETFIAQCMQKIPFPLIVKPCASGSSVGISIAHDKRELVNSLRDSAQHSEYVLVEPFLKNKRELEVSVLGNTAASVQSFGPGEIILHTGEFYDYELKYNSSEKEVGLAIPSDLDARRSAEVRDIAEQAYLALGCQCFARVDLFLAESGDIFVNEINTLPGFTGISMFPKLVMHEGYSAQTLIDTLLKLAKDKYTAPITYSENEGGEIP